MFRSQSAAKVLKIVGAGFLAAILCSCSGASSSKHKIAQILLQYHRDGRFSGSALLGYGNTIVYEGAFGLADETWKIANTPTTRFEIGSLTKQFTAALILELAQQTASILTLLFRHTFPIIEGMWLTLSQSASCLDIRPAFRISSDDLTSCRLCSNLPHLKRLLASTAATRLNSLPARSSSTATAAT